MSEEMLGDSSMEFVRSERCEGCNAWLVPGRSCSVCRVQPGRCPDSWIPILKALQLAYPDFRERDKIIAKFWKDMDAIIEA